MRTKARKKIAPQRMRVPMVKATRPNEKRAMDLSPLGSLMGGGFECYGGRSVHVRMRGTPTGSSLTGQKVALALFQVVAERRAPVSISVDNCSEFVSRAMESWAYQYRVDLDFIRPGRPVENRYVESFNGRLRDECLNVQSKAS